MGARTAGVARLPDRVFGIFDDVKRYDVRTDIGRDGFGNCCNHPKTHFGYVRWNGDYCSNAVHRRLVRTIIITLL